MRKKVIITCVFCSKEHLASSKKVKYCSIACYNKATKRKPADGYKPCEVCGVPMPYRNSLNVRSCNGVKSKRTRFCSVKCSSYWRCHIDNPAKKIEVRKKISASAKLRGFGTAYSKESIEKRRKSISGDKHWNWQGGKTSENKKRRNSYETKQWRKAVFERDDYTCQMCGIRGAYLEADHIKPWCTHPDLRYDLDNGRTLCSQCHRKTDTYGLNATKF